MNKKILVAPTDFKESISAIRVAEIISKKLSSLLHGKNYEIVNLPVSDGGDGFLNSISLLKKTEKLTISIPRHYDFDSYFDVAFLYDKNEKSLYVESANVLGLKLTPENKRNPLFNSSYGLGILLKKLGEMNRNGEIRIEKVIIGIGGTSTQDLGLGIASAFGLRLQKCSHPLPVLPKFYRKAEKILFDKTKFELSYKILTVADVRNPLLGERGSNRIFAKQKGASQSDIKILEEGFQNIIRLLRIKNTENLSGAGGGLAFGLQYFFNAGIIPAEEFIIENFLKHHANSNAVITGEGKIDKQTFGGKAPGIIYEFFNKRKIPVFFIVGENELIENSNFIVEEIYAYYKDKIDSIKNPEKGIELATEKIANKILEKIG